MHTSFRITLGLAAGVPCPSLLLMKWPWPWGKQPGVGILLHSKAFGQEYRFTEDKQERQREKEEEKVEGVLMRFLSTRKDIMKKKGDVSAEDRGKCSHQDLFSRSFLLKSDTRTGGCRC